MGYHPQVIRHMVDQNPTTSQQPWRYGIAHQNVPHNFLHHNERAQHLRSPSRMAPSAQTAQWMNQHYMNNWGFGGAASPAPSVIHPQQADDYMSVLSVNTNVSVMPHEAEAQRCFSSNGSTCENVNPDMNLQQITCEVQHILQVWFTTADVSKRGDMTVKLMLWLKNDALSKMDEQMLSHYVHQLMLLIIDGIVLWRRSTAASFEYFDLACRLFEILHKMSSFPPVLPVISRLFCADQQEGNFKFLLSDFVPITADPRMARCSSIAIELIRGLIMQKNLQLRMQCLKALKDIKIIESFKKHLRESTVCNYKVLIIIKNLVYRDLAMKDFFLRGNIPRTANLPDGNLVQVILECILVRTQNTSDRFQQIVVQACNLLRTLLYDKDAINYFIHRRGIDIVCSKLQQCQDVRVVREAFNLFLHVSDSPEFNNVDIPLVFIISLIEFYQDESIYRFSTGFLSNIVANKPRYKEAAIRSNCIGLLEKVILKFPDLQQTPADKRQYVMEMMSNCFRTLINLLPFWATNAAAMEASQSPEHKQLNQNVLATVNRIISHDILKKLLNIMSFCDVTCEDASLFVELRSHLLRLMCIVFRMPFVNKSAIFEVFDEYRKESIVGNVLNVFCWAQKFLMEKTESVSKDQRERLVSRTMTLVVWLVDSNDIAGGDRTFSNYFGNNSNCPLDMIREVRDDSFVRLVLLFCERIAAQSDEIAPCWLADRAMIEGLANNRNADIAKSANALLNVMPVTSSEPLADVFANSDFY